MSEPRISVERAAGMFGVEPEAAEARGRIETRARAERDEIVERFGQRFVDLLDEAERGFERSVFFGVSGS